MGQGTLRIVVPLFGPSVYPLTGIPWRCHRRAALPEDATWGSWSWVCMSVCQWELAWRALPKFRYDAPSDGCNWAPQSFCPGCCASALSPQPQADPEEAEPRSAAVSPEFQSRQALPAHPGHRSLRATAHLSSAACACGTPAICVLDTTFVWGPRPVPSSGMRDKGCLFFSGTVASPGLCMEHHRIPPAPTGHVSPHCCLYQAGGSAGSWHTADKVCEQRVGSMRALCGHTVRPSPRHGGQARGRGHPPQLRAASRGLGKACVSL